MPKPKLKFIKDEIVFDGKYLQMVLRHFKDAAGKMKAWEMTRRKTPGRIVTVIAITPKNEVILTKSYRLAHKCWIIEPCAGLMDKSLSEKETAREELIEETGYDAKKLELISNGPFDTGRDPVEIAVYLAKNAYKVGPQKLEAGEDIIVIKIPLKKLPALLKNPPRGTKVDLKLWGILYLLREKGYNI